MDLHAAKILSHRRNIERYSQLLVMDITELEREYLHQRIVKEQIELKHWETTASTAVDEGSHRNSLGIGWREITWPLSASPLPLYGGFNGSGPYSNAEWIAVGTELSIYRPIRMTPPGISVHNRLKYRAPAFAA